MPWHRGNLPAGDSWQPALPGIEEIVKGKKVDRVLRELNGYKADLEKALKGANEADIELLKKKVAQWEAWYQDREVDAEKSGYISTVLEGGRERPAIEENGPVAFVCENRSWFDGGVRKPSTNAASISVQHFAQITKRPIH